MAPFAATPDALGEGWRDGRFCLRLHIQVNGAGFGHPNGAAMAVGLHDMIAHAALTRDLSAGTITPFPSFRDCVTMTTGLFGQIDQQVVAARGECATGPRRK